MMKNLQKMGGIAALYAGAAYVVGMVGFLCYLGLLYAWSIWFLCEIMGTSHT
jgi:hypothetical protein